METRAEKEAVKSKYFAHTATFPDGQPDPDQGRWQEFVRDYVGPFRDGTAPCATENHVIPAFREMRFDQPQNASMGRLNWR
jgi:hypothetical protein